jgi:hypothetical protein
VVVVQVKFSANYKEDIKITKVCFKGDSSGSEVDHLASVEFYRDTDGDGLLDETDLLLSQSTYNADDGDVEFSGFSETIPEDQSLYYLLVYDFNLAPIGSTFSASIPNETYISAVGLTSGETPVIVGLPVASSEVEIVASGSPGAMYAVEGGQSPADGNVLADEQVVEMMQIAISVTSVEDIQLQSIIIDATGSADDSTAISGVTLFKDVNGNGVYNAGIDVVLGTPSLTFSVDNGSITFSGLNEQIPAGESIDVGVMYDLSGLGATGETLSLTVNPSTGILGYGLTSGENIYAEGDLIEGAVKTIGETGIVPGSLQIEQISFEPGEEVPPYAHNVLMMKARLTASAIESILVLQVQINSAGSGNEVRDISAVSLYKDGDGDEEFDPAKDILIKEKVSPFSADDGTVTISGLYETIPAGESTVWFIVFDFSGSGLMGGSFYIIWTVDTTLAQGLSSGLFVDVSGGVLIGPEIKLSPVRGSSGKQLKETCIASVGFARSCLFVMFIVFALCIFTRRWLCGVLRLW